MTHFWAILDHFGALFGPFFGVLAKMVRFLQVEVKIFKIELYYIENISNIQHLEQSGHLGQRSKRGSKKGSKNSDFEGSRGPGTPGSRGPDPIGGPKIDPKPDPFLTPLFYTYLLKSPVSGLKYLSICSKQGSKMTQKWVDFGYPRMGPYPCFGVPKMTPFFTKKGRFPNAS